jgi:uncharacterized membrane protein YuzA (DUF378 family)
MKAMKVFDILVAVLLVLGGLNWGLIGLFQFDLVATICGGLAFGETNLVSRLIYILVGAAAGYQVFSLKAVRRRWGVRTKPPPICRQVSPKLSA